MEAHIPLLVLLGVGGVGAAVAPSTAVACGGCFAPPGAVQVVTDHRMVLSLSAARTVLWDQFRYSGRPEEFSWILPIRNGPDVRIELASDRFIRALDQVSAPVLERPAFPTCADGLTPDSLVPERPLVTVIGEQVLGPYMTAVVRSDDPAALRTWLRESGYSVPAPVEPVIDFYVAQRMDFLALRLRPGEGVDQMTPVRVTTPGMHPTLPLRMIAAGVADEVGLLLLVLAASRYEAANFPNGEVTPALLSYDFAAPTSPAADFLAAFDRLNRRHEGRLWLTESALRVGRAQIENASRVGEGADPRLGHDDASVAFSGIGEGAILTRLRAELPAWALDRDLQLQASDRGDRSPVHQYGALGNVPPPCAVAVAPEARAPVAASCAAGAGAGAGVPRWGLLAVALALVGLRRRPSRCAA
ncbi:MAG: hypothetical protein JWM10_1220 [Myxococcaceae bacterium]|nr:hypothetical protein [Myxococcaceae bacterium]